MGNEQITRTVTSTPYPFHNTQIEIGCGCEILNETGSKFQVVVINPEILVYFLRDSIPGLEVEIPGLRIPILGKFSSELRNFFR